MSKEMEFFHYSVAGRPVKCSHCGNETFGEGSALLNTRALTFFNLDWANRAAHILICRTCGKVEWFLQAPQKRS